MSTHRSILVAVAVTTFAGYLAAQSEEIVVPDFPPPQKPGHYEIRLYRIEAAHARALSDARRDIAAGNLIRIEYGLQIDPARRFAHRLEEKWKIKIESKGCVESPDEEAYTHVYNALMEDEIFRRYGVRYEALAEPIEKAIDEEAHRVAGGD